MDLKEYMQQKAEDPFLSDLSEEDKEYCREVEASYVKEHTAKPVVDRRKFWAFFSSAAAILVAAVVLICIYLIPKKPPLKYLDEKIVSQQSNIEELNNDSKYFKVSLIDNNTFTFSMNYDSASNDKLYYETHTRGFFGSSYVISSIIVVINKNYDYPFDKPVEAIKEQLNGYELNYLALTVEGLDSTQYSGWIQLKTETVYITYTQTPSLGDDKFFEYVQSVVQAK